MYDAIYDNMYRETLWELNMGYMPVFKSKISRHGVTFLFDKKIEDTTTKDDDRRSPFIVTNIAHPH